MSTSPAPMLPVQSAIDARLRGDPELMGMIDGLYDYVPEVVPYPFIVTGDALETPDDRHGSFGRQTVVALNVWSQYRGYAQVLRIGARVTALLDHQPLTVPGLNHIVTRYEFGQTLTDPEPPGDIRHLILRYRVVTEEP
ncbi:DUF3168 domain-containing protein [Streptomyces sp. NPDC059818]|uniref:DUF3168 domain-containing protein n=1 Tax=Streptomyces sp. NPDC059818 TaxID=3346962 RepID=UPI00365454B5